MDTADYFELFNNSGTDVPVNREQLLSLLNTLSEGESVEFSLLELVYVDEQEIVRINSDFLDRDYITDIITFRYDEEESDDASGIEGTLYCCAQRIQEQAGEFGSSRQEEFKRIFVHGLLHLCGYDDQDKASKATMTRLENHYLSASAEN